MTRTTRIFLVVMATLAVLFALQELKPIVRAEIRGAFGFAGQYSFMITYALNGFFAFLVGTIPFALIELTSRDRNDDEKLFKRYMIPVAIWACYYAISSIVVMNTYLIKYYTGIGTIHLPFVVPYFIHLGLYIVLLDFFGYWFHRAEHAIPLLWKFHATHHSIQNINAFNQYGHWFEGMFRFFFVYTPVSLFIPAPDIAASSIGVIWGTWTFYIHSNASDLRMPRRARYIMVDNLFHHYHHGVEKEFYDRNFGFFFSIWDHIFGTSLQPTSDEFPKTGLHDLEPPAGPLAYIVHPFKSNRR